MSLIVLLLLFPALTSAQSGIKLDTPITVTILKGEVFNYYVDVPAKFGAFQYMTVNIQRLSGIGWYKVQLKQGSGALFDDTRPGGTSWSYQFQVTSEAAPGDCSGRWYITVSSCSSCTGVGASSSYQLVAQLHDFDVDRAVILGGAGNTITTVGSSWGMLYVDVTTTNPAVLTVTALRISSDPAAFAQLYVANNRIPTTSSWDYFSPNSGNFYSNNMFIVSQPLKVGISGSGRYFIGMLGCGTCTGNYTTYEYTSGTYQVTASLQAWDEPHFSLSSPHTAKLASDEWAQYSITIPGDIQHVATITLKSNTPNGLFKVYTRKGAFPTSSTYTTMVPSSTTYSGEITTSIIPTTTDLGGNWYVGVRFCRQCNGNSMPFDAEYTISATVALTTTTTTATTATTTWYSTQQSAAATEAGLSLGSAVGFSSAPVTTNLTNVEGKGAIAPEFIVLNI